MKEKNGCIKTIDEFFDEIKKVKEKVYEIYRGFEERELFLYPAKVFELWFRGEGGDVNFSLTPTIFRSFLKGTGSIDYYVNFEKRLYKEAWFHFHREYSNFAEIYNLDVLAILRHLGIRARLLDFSTDPLVALYFACCQQRNTDNSDGNKNPVVYVLVPNFLNTQISYLTRIGFISTKEDFNVRTRLQLYEFSKHLGRSQIKEEILDILVRNLGFDKKRFCKELKILESWLNDKGFGFEKLQDLKEYCEDKNGFPYSIFQTPIAVSFQYRHDYMRAQRAVGILWGDIYTRDRKRYDLDYYLEEFRGFFLKYNDGSSITDKVLYKIPICKEKKEEICNYLRVRLGVSKYRIFGEDLRFVEDKIELELKYN